MRKYFSTNVDTIPNHRLEFKNFLGVDYFHSRQDVALNRAVEMSNLINRDGINQKRFGFTQVNSFEDGNFNGLKINGIWTLTTDSNHGSITKTIIHAGTSFFYIDGCNLSSSHHPLPIHMYDFTTEYETNSSYYINKIAKVRNEKSFGVVKGNRLYILCGLYLVFGTWDNGETFELRLVENNSDTYIPTTTIGIQANESGIDTREDFDEPNMLCKYRINQVVPFTRTYDEIVYDNNNSIYENSQGFSAYHKHSAVLPKLDINGYWLVTIDDLTFWFNKNELDPSTSDYHSFMLTEYTTEYQNFLKDHLIKGNLNDNISATTIVDKSIYCFTVVTSNDNLNYLVIGTYQNNNDFNLKVEFQASQTFNLDSVINANYPIKLNGKSITGLYTISSNQITLSFPLLEEAEVMFVASGYEDNADLINDCKFGLLYQYNELFHLFVSGNENYPNYDWHSGNRHINYTQEFTQTEDEDLTYFGTESYYALGNSNNAIIGYSLLQDNVIGVHKSYNTNETLMWLRKPTIKEFTINDVNIYKLLYSHSPTAITEGAVNHESIHKLYNDNLFISKNGVYKIQMSNNLLSDIRIAVERSGIVNNRLRKEDLEHSTSIVHDNRLYISLPNGKVYIADSRFRNQVSGELPDTYSYEFWVWNNIPVRLWFENNGVLGFGTEDGKICLFETDNSKKFIDETYKQYERSIFTNNISEKMFINSDIDINGNSIIRFITPVKVLVFDGVIDDSICVCSNLEEFQRQVEPAISKKVKVSINGEAEEDYYIISNNQQLANSFYLLADPNDESTRLAIDNEHNIFIYRYIDRDYKVNSIVEDTQDLDDNAQTTKYITLDSVYCNNYEEVEEGLDPTFADEIFIGSDETISFKVINQSIVNGYWVTPSVNFGYPNINKSIYKFTLVPEHFINSLIKCRYILPYRTTELIADGSSIFDFNSFDYNELTFNTTELDVSYNSRKLLRNVNYIQFEFYSENEYNFAINSFALEYKLMKNLKGVH